MRVMSMPDKWEYPWFAAWDLAFHAVAVRRWSTREFAKEQLWLLLFEQFQHPNGQTPGLRVGVLRPEPAGPRLGRLAGLQHGPHPAPGEADRDFLERCFHKLLINFAWWVNKVDAQGNNVFEGGFLGLDNITRVRPQRAAADGGRRWSSPTPPAGWAMFCLNLMRIALELAKDNPVYEGLATSSSSTTSTSARR